MPGPVDPEVGIAQVLSLFVGSALAATLAPHLVVLIGGFAGGIIGLMSWRKCSIWMGALYVVGMGGIAWFFTGSAADLLAVQWPALSDKRYFGLIALLIGAIGHRWKTLGDFAFLRARAMLKAALSGGASQ